MIKLICALAGVITGLVAGVYVGTRLRPPIIISPREEERPA